VVIASEEAVKEHKLTPLARIVAYHATGCDPSIMGIGEWRSFSTDVKYVFPINIYAIPVKCICTIFLK